MLGKAIFLDKHAAGATRTADGLPRNCVSFCSEVKDKQSQIKYGCRTYATAGGAGPEIAGRSLAAALARKALLNDVATSAGRVD